MLPPTPWKSAREPTPEREYFLSVTHLPLRKPWLVPRFVRYVRSVQRQLRRTPGVVGYSLLARPLRGDYYTLSAWEDEAAAVAFLGGSPHLEAMTYFRPRMGGFRSARWNAPGAALPPDWDGALARLADR